MKKLWSILFALIAAFTLTFGLAACGDTEDDNTDTEEATFWGTYYFYSVTFDGVTYYRGDSEMFTKDFMVYTINEDGTFTMTMSEYEEPFSGTWTGSGTSYVLTWDGISANATWDGDKTLTWGDEETYVYTLVKDSGDTEDDNTDTEEATFWGTYYFYSMTYNGETYTVGDEIYGVTLTKDFMVFAINEDGTFTGTYSQDSETVSGTWTGSGTAYALTAADDDGNTYTYNATWNGNDTITMKGGDEEEYTFVRAGSEDDDNNNVEEGNNNTIGGTVEEATLWGTYYFYSMTYEGKTYYRGDTMGSMTLTKDYVVFILNENFTFTATVLKDGETVYTAVSCMWKADGAYVWFFSETDDSLYTMTWDRDKTLTWKTEDGYVCTFVKD